MKTEANDNTLTIILENISTAQANSDIQTFDILAEAYAHSGNSDILLIIYDGDGNTFVMFNHVPYPHTPPPIPYSTPFQPFQVAICTADSVLKSLNKPKPVNVLLITPTETILSLVKDDKAFVHARYSMLFGVIHDLFTVTIMTVGESESNHETLVDFTYPLPAPQPLTMPALKAWFNSLT